MELIVGAASEIDAGLLVDARALMDRAFEGDFDDHDWDHALGGHHAVAVDDGDVVAHASVVRRTLWVGDRAVATGYVEAVATEPRRQGEGHGAAVMRAIGDLIAHHHEMGALGTGEHRFYERLGWQRWRGPTFVRRTAGESDGDGGDGDGDGDGGGGTTDERSEEDDDGIMVLLHDRSPTVDLTAPLTCEERPGDDW